MVDRNTRSKIGEVKHCSICGEAGHSKVIHSPTKQTKACGGCGGIFPLSAFRLKRRARANGFVREYTTPVCIRCDIARSAARYRSGFRPRLGYLLASIKARCKEHGVVCSIDVPYLEVLLEKQGGLCFYSGRTLSLETGDDAVSVDRRVPDGGYTPDNVVLTCWLVNHMKRRTPEGEFVALCRAIAERRP